MSATPSFTYESDLGDSNLNVVGFACNLLENGNPSNNVVHIKAGNTVTFALRWTQTGDAPQNSILAADLHWHPRVYLEKMGPGDGPSLPFGQYQAIVQGQASVNYADNTITIPTNILTEGVYKFVVTLNMYKQNHPTSIFHGYYEPEFMFEALVGYP